VADPCYLGGNAGMQLGFEHRDANVGEWKLCRPYENDLIALALEPNRVHDDPLIVWGAGGANSDAQQDLITAGFGLGPVIRRK
jgi:hypothetical protein